MTAAVYADIKATWRQSCKICQQQQRSGQLEDPGLDRLSGLFIKYTRACTGGRATVSFKCLLLACVLGVVVYAFPMVAPLFLCWHTLAVVFAAAGAISSGCGRAH